jgi:hypothetical protein
MTIDEFWAIVGKAGTESRGDDEAFLENVRARLRELRPEEIVSFDVHYDVVRFRAYRKELWGAAYLMNGGCSDDGFEYFRAWLISRGKKVYEKALVDPDSLADVCDPECDCYELEEFMGLAGEVYESLTGKPLPARKREFPKLSGREWGEDSLESLYPRISAKMGGGDV